MTAALAFMIKTPLSVLKNMITKQELAEMMFEAYNEKAGGKTWDGKDIPPFSQVGEKVQGNWIAAAEKAIEIIGQYNNN